ncbi:hypothetical protein HBH98_160810 [Parastagonospora nodorum]|nr:hypothetical protein HBH51_029670 [Parastagonospora nodorum]KAH4000602.1 hypothetical protein HBI10_102420 [Parastagonospora nodorum]KAH4026514.1 hypothetical protein HBI13_063190 [Parastagonospora nodorum]KAH4036580.1 hypothetical protein HBI09_074710 [Parastagonospora nodorum]KAH4052015.1 hypothetical protein HBH49_110920 [Parastagonospora nodorum]
MRAAVPWTAPWTTIHSTPRDVLPAPVEGVWLEGVTPFERTARAFLQPSRPGLACALDAPWRRRGNVLAGSATEITGRSLARPSPRQRRGRARLWSHRAGPSFLSHLIPQALVLPVWSTAPLCNIAAEKVPVPRGNEVAWVQQTRL